MWQAYPTKLRADFQEFYGLDLTNMKRDLSAQHVAALACELPPTSRTKLALTSGRSASRAELLALSQDYSLRQLIYIIARAFGSRGIERPRPYELSELAGVDEIKAQEYATSIQDIDYILKRPRQEVRNFGKA